MIIVHPNFTSRVYLRLFKLTTLINNYLTNTYQFYSSIRKEKSMNSHKAIAIKLLVLNLLYVFATGDVEPRCIEKEREALLSFKNGLIDEQDFLSSWRSDECCKWDGIVCSNTTGHVIFLLLDSAEVGGKIGSSLLELHHLIGLDLSHNDFGGDRIPEFIGSMKRLQELYLSDSNFSGIFPPQIRNLTNLRMLDISYNSLGSRNLDWLSHLSSLVYLDLSYSFDLSDGKGLQHILSLPSLQTLHLEFCNISSYVKPSATLFVNFLSLLYLDLSHNNLTSSAFQWLPNITTSLMKLDLSYNALGGQIPDAFERFIFLEFVDLSSNMLEGEVPKSLANLSHLRVLVLYDNHFSGSIDDALLRNASTMASLQVLDLAHNKFNGSVPDLTRFSALKEVYLGRNTLTGPVPLSLGQLSNLVVLEVSQNKLNGTVSESHLAKLHNLKMLDLSFNLLSLLVAPDWDPPFQLHVINLAGCNIGSGVPIWIQTQRNVTDLDLSETGIVGEVPKWLWSFSSSLKVLFLSHNQITGTLPDLSSTPIFYLDVSFNKISGPIPLFHPNTNSFQLRENMFSGSISSICEITHDSLFFFDLSDNHFSGEIPNCWEKMPGLFYLNLGNNSFSGKIPDSLGLLQHFSMLQLHDNNLSGELPSTFGFCKKLSVIDVGGNELTGYIPSWIGHTNIKFLNFRKNRFYGSICQEICNLNRIHVLDLSRNNLSGKIPDCFNNFTTLADKNTPNMFFGFRFIYQYNSQLPNMIMVKDYSSFSSVGWKNHESESIQNLLFLKLIDFSSNSLTGGIPESFSSMRALGSLNLSRNSLTGNIIPNIGKMERLESLDLSHNQLSGQIPTSLAELSLLGVLDLSNNNLSGKIPLGTQLQSFNASSYEGNNGLCGPPLGLCPENRQVRHGEKDGGVWSLSFMQEFGIAMIFGCIVGFWGVVGCLVLKKSWRYAYFNFLDVAGDWLYVTTTIFLSKWRRS